jgi:hypothetical protein
MKIIHFSIAKNSYIRYEILNKIFNPENNSSNNNYEFINSLNINKINQINEDYIKKKINIFTLFKLLNDYSHNNNIQYSVISFENAYFSSFEKLNILMTDFINSGCLIGGRMSKANAENLLFDSLRSPLLDMHFFLLNNKILHEKNFFINSIKVFDHSSKMGGLHNEVMSFLERNLKKNEFFNFFTKNIFNQNGKDFKTLYIPFSICTKYGLITCNYKVKKNLYNLLKYNCLIKNYNNNFNINYFKIDNFYFLKNYFSFNFLLSSIKKLFIITNTVNKKIRAKGYENLDDDRFNK